MLSCGTLVGTVGQVLTTTIKYSEGKILRNRMYTKLKDEEERLLTKPNFMNVPTAIR